MHDVTRASGLVLPLTTRYGKLLDSNIQAERYGLEFFDFVEKFDLLGEWCFGCRHQQVK
jgi:hypothetical protein